MGNKITYELKRTKRTVRNKVSVHHHLHRRKSSKQHLVVAYPEDSKKHGEFDLQLLTSQTHFSPVELKIMKILFAGHCSDPNRLVATREDCRHIFFRKLLLHNPQFQFTPAHEFILDAVFNAVNTDGDGYVSFTELALATSCAVHGTFEEKLALSFRLYDLNGDGVLTKDEMRQYIRILNSIGVLRLSTPLQTLRTRGDVVSEEVNLIKMRSLVNVRRDNPDIEINGSGAAQQQMIPAQTYRDQNAPVFDPGAVDNNPCITLSDMDIEALLERFFFHVPEMNFENYVAVSKMNRHLAEGLGLYDYIFYQNVAQDVSEFLHRPDRFHQGAIMQCDSKVAWVEIRDGSIFHCDPNTRHIQRQIPINKIKNIFTEDNTFTIQLGSKCTRYTAENIDVCRLCLMCLLLYFVSQIDNRFDAFSPMRSADQTWFHPLIDGEETYAMMSKILLKAKKQVFIAGWSVNPFIYLRRDSHSDEDMADYRLDNILLAIAKQNVEIYIIMWHEFAMAGMNLSTNMIRQHLVDLHPNIRCIVHPRNLPFSWSHHQKIIVVDQTIAFVGGLDIALGRWDNHNHSLSDYNHLHTKWPGMDYTNDTLARLGSGKPMKLKTDAFRDQLDRDMFPRLPWHDVHCVLAGTIASDVASNFISRWNHHNRVDRGDQAIEEVNYYRKSLTLSEPLPNLQFYLEDVPMTHVRVQALRSLSLWSGSLRTEQSIHRAIVEVIRNAQYYVYIENQYFISKTMYSDKVENGVAEAIIARISKAIANNEVFRVIIVLPMHHSGDIYDPSTHQVMKWQRATIEGIFATLQQQFPHANIGDYIVFFSLAQKGFIHGVPHFSQIYVHAKVLITDDRTLVIGSANINDRSLIGSRDSEIAVIVEDLDTTMSIFNGHRVKTGKSIKRMRKKLWREHFMGDPTLNRLASLRIVAPAHKNISKTDLFYSQTKDPTSNTVFHAALEIAKQNSALYEQIFPHYPSKRHVTLAEYKHDVENYVKGVREGTFKATEEDKKLMNQIIGHAVLYPRDWLIHDQFKKDTRLKVVDESVFF